MQQPRGPATLCIKAKEIDALYDALGKIQRAFAAAAIPWTLTGGSALGAVRSASILFCDDDIDLAVLGREHFERARRALRAIPGLRHAPAGGRNGLCWDRVRPEASPGVWVDVFLLVEYASLDALREAVASKRNGSPQDGAVVAAAVAPCAALPADAWPLWHFGEIEARGAGLAIQKWPGEFVTRPELPFRGGGHAFGPLADVPLPPRPLSYLVRAFGDDCLAVYYVDREHEQYRTGNAAGAPPRREKTALAPELYRPVMPSRRDARVRSDHGLPRLRAKVAAMAATEGLEAPPRLPPPRLLVVSNGPVAEAWERDAGHGRYALGWGAPIRAADVVRAAAGYEAVVCATETVCANDLEPLRRACEKAGVGCRVVGERGDRTPDGDDDPEARGFRRWCRAAVAGPWYAPAGVAGDLDAPGFLRGRVVLAARRAVLASGVRATPPKRPLVVLAAGVGSRLRASANVTLPKCCVDVGGRSIFERMAGNAAAAGVEAVVVVVGFRRDVVEAHVEAACAKLGIEATFVVNDDYASTNTCKSLLAALRAAPSLLDGFLLADGDLVCDAEVFDRVARFPGSCAAVARPSPLAASSEDAEAVRCLTNARHQITKIGKAIGPGSVGECVGLYGVSGSAVAGARLPFFLDASEASEYYEDSFDRALRAGGPRRLDMVALDVTGFACVEVDDGEDLAAAVGAVGVVAPPVVDGVAVADLPAAEAAAEDAVAPAAAVPETARHPEDGRVTPCEGPGAEDALPAADDVETVALPEAERLDYARMKEELEAMKRTNADARALFRGLEIDDIDADLDALAGRPPAGDAAPAWNTR